jgi:hypothetical protein
MLRLIIGFGLIFIFFISHNFYLQIVFLLCGVFVLPLPYLTLLPFVIIYDLVFMPKNIPIFSIITIGLIIISYFLKPFIRKQ